MSTRIATGRRAPFRASLVLALSLCAPAAAAEGYAGDPAIRRALQAAVDDGGIAGAVALVERAGRIASVEAAGRADIAAGTPMRTDMVFAIASMTKPFVAAAVLMLQDEGRLAIDDPLEKYLPEFGRQMVVAEESTDRVVLRRPARPVTLRMLLTHTSGMNTDSPDECIGLTQERKARFYARQPLAFEPGSRWQYSNPGINLLARVVEVAGRTSFERFLQERIFDPLGMNDTTFWPSAAQLRQLATMYESAGGNGGLRPVKIPYLGVLDLASRERPPLPAGGLFSTAADLRKFYGMLLAGGVHDGRRYLSEAAWAEMTHAQTGELKVTARDGAAWGLGVTIVREPLGATARLSPGTFGHSGAYGTVVWCDPHTRSLYLVLMQRVRPGPVAAQVHRQFLEAATGGN